MRIILTLIAALICCSPALAQSMVAVVASCPPTKSPPYAVGSSAGQLTIDVNGVLCTNATGGGGGAGDASAANQSLQITQETAINTVLGTVTASPTANTIADRLKTLNTTLGSPLQAGGTVAVTGVATAANQATEIASLATIATNTGAPIPAGTAEIGNVKNSGTFAVQSASTLAAETTKVIGTVRNADGSGNLYVADPCGTVAQTSTPISITTNTTTRIVAPTSAKKTYICYLFLTSAAADNVGIVEGTGGTCGTGTAGVIGGATAANGPNFAANGGAAFSAGGLVAAAVTAGTNVDLCLITSASTPLAGVIKWVQAP